MLHDSGHSGQLKTDTQRWLVVAGGGCLGVVKLPVLVVWMSLGADVVCVLLASI